MSKNQIKQIIENRTGEAGMVETGVKGVKLFRVTESLRCAPAVYEPTVVAIVSGSKEAILDGNRHVYDSRKYMCCTMSMPVEAGIDAAPRRNDPVEMPFMRDRRLFA